MAQNDDIQVSIENDLLFADGDLLVSEASEQQVQNILQAAPGQFRNSPLVGLDVTSLQNATVNRESLKGEIKLQLSSDGFNVRQVRIADTPKLTVEIDAVKVR